MNKYKHLRGRRQRAEKWLSELKIESRNYLHIGAIDKLILLNDKSRMKGDFHVRFCEKFGVKFLLLTRLRGRKIK